jgi:hypothetical protein
MRSVRPERNHVRNHTPVVHAPQSLRYFAPRFLMTGTATGDCAKFEVARWPDLSQVFFHHWLATV